MLISEMPRLFGKIFFLKKAQHRCQHGCKETGSHGRAGGQTNCPTTSGSHLAASPTVTKVCMLSTAQHLWEGHMRGAKEASAADQEGATWTSNCRDRGLACGHSSEDPTEAARAPERLRVLTACPHFFVGWGWGSIHIGLKGDTQVPEGKLKTSELGAKGILASSVFLNVV